MKNDSMIQQVLVIDIILFLVIIPYNITSIGTETSWINTSIMEPSEITPEENKMSKY